MSCAEYDKCHIQAGLKEKIHLTPANSKRIKAVAVYGKEPFTKPKVELKQKTHVVVDTPGRVMDHIERETLVLDQIKYLIIDEADEMLNRGFIIEETRQNSLYSIEIGHKM